MADLYTGRDDTRMPWKDANKHIYMTLNAQQPDYNLAWLYFILKNHYQSEHRLSEVSVWSRIVPRIVSRIGSRIRLECHGLG